jgi:phosphohistidine phosphatase SixA
MIVNKTLRSPVLDCHPRRPFLREFLIGIIACTASAVSLLAAATSPGTNASPTASNGPTPEQLLNELRKGGCVIYVRHAQTDRSRDDALQPDMNDCATQRMLSREGEKQADEVGAAVRELGVPVGQIFCSPYCRAKETARRAFPQHKAIEVPELSRLARVTLDKVPACSAALKQLLAREPKETENNFIVGHYENLVAAGGPDLEEAGWAVFRPDKNSSRLIGRLNPAQWRALVGTARSKK